MNILESFACFENEIKNNQYLHVKRTPGRHCIQIYSRCPEGAFVLSFILRDFQQGVYQDLTCTEIKSGGLEVCLLDYSQILSDEIANHLPPLDEG